MLLLMLEVTSFLSVNLQIELLTEFGILEVDSESLPFLWLEEVLIALIEEM